MYKLIIKSNYYKDSITLMAITNKVNSLDGVIESTLGMATDMNKEIIEKIGFSKKELNKAKSSDMLIALKLEDNSNLEGILNEIENLLNLKEEDNKNLEYSNLKQALSENENLNMAVVSIPGNHAYIEVKRCLETHAHVRGKVVKEKKRKNCLSC